MTHKPVTHQSSFSAGSKGFTLIELAIVIVIVGILIGMGAGLLGPLTERTKLHATRETVSEVYEAIIGYATANKTLPSALSDLGVKTKDGYNKSLLYYKPDNFTGDICTTRPAGGSFLTVDDKGTSKPNVAFVVLSEGANMCNQTGTGTPFTISETEVTYACLDGSDDNALYDDTAMYMDINSLRKNICNSFRAVTDSLPLGTEETAYPSTTMEATDGTPSYTWVVSSGALPTGLSLNSSGLVSGTPTADGSFNFTVTVTDVEGRTATKSFSITINPNDPKVTTEYLVYGTATQAYPSTTLSVTGGNSSSYSWCVCQNPPSCTTCNTGAGILPPGLLLNASGGISGTPTTAGTYSFTVRVTDGGSRTAFKTLSIAINPAP